MLISCKGHKILYLALALGDDQDTQSNCFNGFSKNLYTFKFAFLSLWYTFVSKDTIKCYIPYQPYSMTFDEDMFTWSLTDAHSDTL